MQIGRIKDAWHHCLVIMLDKHISTQEQCQYLFLHGYLVLQVAWHK
jgi:hypothetical protein